MAQHASKRAVPAQQDANLGTLAARLMETRRLSLELAAPLSPEDMVVQAMEDASPTKWHLAHVTWFFETFILTRHLAGYRLFDETFNYCFNSYYESQGKRQPRPKRGLLQRLAPYPARLLQGYRLQVNPSVRHPMLQFCAMRPHPITPECPRPVNAGERG